MMRLALSLALAFVARGLFIDKQQCDVLGLAGCRKRGDCLWHKKGCQQVPANTKRSNCNDGSNWVDCFDVDRCANGMPGPTPDARWAFVLTDSLEHPFKGLDEDNLKPLREAAERHGNTDILLLVPNRGAETNGWHDKVKHSITHDQEKALLQQNVTMRKVAWALPPGRLYRPKLNWCGARDFIRLHVLGLEPYAAVAYMDSDIQLTGRGNIGNLMKCAASGHFLSSSGPLSPLNSGLFAVRPSSTLLKAAVKFAEVADYRKMTGWAGAGQAPGPRDHIGAECGQGFLHTLLYKSNAPEVQLAVTKAGATAHWPKAVQMERCIWNRQHGTGCSKDAGCKDVVAIHKSDSGDICQKLNTKPPAAKGSGGGHSDGGFDLSDWALFSSLDHVRRHTDVGAAEVNRTRTLRGSHPEFYVE